MLMYLFDEKCVLFPKLLSLTSLRHNVIYEFIPVESEVSDMLPVDFVSTQWVDKSACYLPTYVPLVSGIFGLVWTTMFLMCSTGSRTLTGLQRPWRVLPPVFIFSLAMSGLCIYSSTVTHYGLQELCVKLGEITGSSTCTYTVNVATLAYERRIRGVYQATRLTILSAWLHTACWILSALLALARVLMAVDFQLVRIKVDLRGDIDKILESNEEQIRTVFPEVWINDDGESNTSLYTPSQSSTKVHFKNKYYAYSDSAPQGIANLSSTHSDIVYFSKLPAHTSELSLVPEERNKLTRLTAYQSVSKDKQFIVKLLYDLIELMYIPESIHGSLAPSGSSSSFGESESDNLAIVRQYGQELISSKTPNIKARSTSLEYVSVDLNEAEDVAREIKRKLQDKLNQQLVELPIQSTSIPSSSLPRSKIGHRHFESSLNITSELRQTVESNLNKGKTKIVEKISGKKSNLKNKALQTDKEKKTIGGSNEEKKVQISEPRGVRIENEPSKDTVDINKEIQTHEKEKQD